MKKCQKHIKKGKILKEQFGDEFGEINIDDEDLFLVIVNYVEEKVEIEKIEGSPTKFLNDKFKGKETKNQKQSIDICSESLKEIWDNKYDEWWDKLDNVKECD